MYNDDQKQLINNENILIIKKVIIFKFVKPKFDLLNMSKKDYAKS